MVNNLQTKKLEIYLKTITKGFLLLTTNDNYIQKQLVELICTINPSYTIYDMRTIEFREILTYLKSPIKTNTIIYENFDQPEENLHLLLEKINLARDLMLQQNIIFIFIVPLYISNLIQLDYPNLYSYFLYKGEYTTTKKNILSYILPESQYLHTKESQHALNLHFISNKNKTLEDELTYFRIKKINIEECNKLYEKIEKKIALLEKDFNHNKQYICSLLKNYAQVLFAQEYYNQAYNTYQFINNLFEDEKNNSFFLQSIIGMGDVKFTEKKYEEALKIYNKAIMQLSELTDYSSDTETESTRNLLYERIALCYARQQEYEAAKKYMDTIDKKFEIINTLNNLDTFSIYYNYFLILLNQQTTDHYIFTKILHTLENISKNNIQECMYSTLYSWYIGVIQGNINKALPIALYSLNVKRTLLIENDKRIAESHYVISTLYMMLGNTSQAKYCCKKAKNILNNYHEKNKELIEKIVLLEKMIPDSIK